MDADFIKKIGELTVPLGTFFGVYSEPRPFFKDSKKCLKDGVFEYRCGTIIVTFQQLHMDHNADGTITLEYQPATTILSMNLPYELPSLNLEYNTEIKARRGLDDLLKGEELFRGQANRHLDSGIYYPAGRLWAKINRTAFSLTVVEAMKGRFLIGYADDHMQKDNDSEYEIAPLATAWLLAQIFPEDTVLRQSYDWIARNCALNLGNIASIEKTLENICSGSFDALAVN